MSSPPSDINLNDYYDNSPNVLIRDFKGVLYSFPDSDYDNGNGGSSASASDGYTYANGKKWAGSNQKIYKDQSVTNKPWSDTKKININNYNDKGGSVSSDPDNNANNYNNITTLNNFETPLGYDKKSSGSGDSKGKDTRNYIIANVSGYDNFHYAVYTKKSLDGFFNDLVGKNKATFLKLAARSCTNKDFRFGWGICKNICDNNNDYKRSLTNADIDNCKIGAREWCKSDDSRIVSVYDNNVDPSTTNQCREFVTNGDFDNKIGPWCEKNDKITTKWCTDIRKNKGKDTMKTRLDKYLFNNYCNNDTNIIKSECSDVRNICNDTIQLSSDNAPYNCNSLVKGLSNDSNIKSITTNLDLRNVPSTVNKSDLLNSFNESSTDAVEDALCSLINNKSDNVCVIWNNIRKSESNLSTIRDAINKSIASGGDLSEDVINYITKDYMELQKVKGIDKYPNSNILNSDLTTFCELSDSELVTKLCKNIYNQESYKKDPIIKESIDRINDYAFCIATNAFMGKSKKDNDPYNTICVARRDNPATFAKYLPLAIRYCGFEDNIISQECMKYYNDVVKNTNMLLQISYIQSNKSLFSNKERFNNKGDNSQYQNIFLFIIFICFILILTNINGNKYNNRKFIKNNIIYKKL